MHIPALYYAQWTTPWRFLNSLGPQSQAQMCELFLEKRNMLSLLHNWCFIWLRRNYRKNSPTAQWTTCKQKQVKGYWLTVCYCLYYKHGLLCIYINSSLILTFFGFFSSNQHFTLHINTHKSTSNQCWDEFSVNTVNERLIFLVLYVEYWGIYKVFIFSTDKLPLSYPNNNFTEQCGRSHTRHAKCIAILQFSVFVMD